MKRGAPRRRSGGEAGLTIVETIVAAAILFLAVTGLLGPFLTVVNENKTQGELATRTTEYCQDKMEQLMALSFADGSTDTRQYPPSPSGGTGLGGSMAASSTAGGTNLALPVTGYADYLDRSGTLLSNSTGSFYERVWSISSDATANLKTITVVTIVTNTAGLQGAAPQAQLQCVKASLQ